MKFRLVALALAALASPVFATTTAAVTTSNWPAGGGRGSAQPPQGLIP